MTRQVKLKAELKGALAATVPGLINAIGPVLLFVSLLGPQVVLAGFWASLVTASIVPILFLLLKGQPAVIPTVRTASLVAYISLVTLMCQAMGATNGGFSLQQLTLGLVAGSVMFLAASTLVLLTGLLKWGTVFKMIPTPVTAGIGNGIALVLLSLAIQTLAAKGWATLAIALMMPLIYLAWPSLQRRVAALEALPSVLAALLCGFAAA